MTRIRVSNLSGITAPSAIVAGVPVNLIYSEDYLYTNVAVPGSQLDLTGLGNWALASAGSSIVPGGGGGMLNVAVSNTARGNSQNLAGAPYNLVMTRPWFVECNFVRAATSNSNDEEVSWTFGIANLMGLRIYYPFLGPINAPKCFLANPASGSYTDMGTIGLTANTWTRVGCFYNGAGTLSLTMGSTRVLTKSLAVSSVNLVNNSTLTVKGVTNVGVNMNINSLRVYQ